MRTELYQAADRVIRPAPSLHHTFDTLIKNAAYVLFHCGISLKEQATPGSHEAAGRLVGAGGRPVAEKSSELSHFFFSPIIFNITIYSTQLPVTHAHTRQKLVTDF